MINLTRKYLNSLEKKFDVKFKYKSDKEYFRHLKKQLPTLHKLILLLNLYPMPKKTIKKAVKKVVGKEMMMKKKEMMKKKGMYK